MLAAIFRLCQSVTSAYGGRKSEPVIFSSLPRAGRSLRLWALTLVLAATPGLAVGQSLSVIRDAEIEQLLRDYADPIFGAAGIDAGAARIILIGDRRFNAFVANGRQMFINIGAIMESETPNQLIGVIAHEAGHIAGGHLARLRQEIANAQILAVIGTLIGVAAVGTSIASDNVGLGGNPNAIIFGPQELARRNLLSYQRSEEQAADRAALNYLDATNQSARGMLETFQRFANDQLFSSSNADPYLQSHPMAPERIANIESVAAESAAFDRPDPPALAARHALARAKLFGFSARFDEVQRRYPPRDDSLAARYARAIATYRAGQIRAALPLIDGLLKAQAKNPYFWELKGQVLLESGQAQAALAPLRQAVKLAPRQPLIRGLLAEALVATGEPANLTVAIKELKGVIGRDRQASNAWQILARAYGLQGNQPLADLATAEAYMIAGRRPEAVAIARRAQSRFKPGSPDWLRADDIIGAGADQE
jgi:predicted Zn-dependent protease